MKKFFLVPVFGLLLASCGGNTSSNTADSTATDSATLSNTTEAPAITATYAGLLPGADNDGFETTLELYNDGNFVMTQTAKGKTDTISSSYTLVGDTLTLQGFAMCGIAKGDSISFLDTEKKPTVIPYILRKK